MIILRRARVGMPMALAILASSAPQAIAQFTVFDPANYQENLLSAVRALEQINNQVRVLQNQVLMIQRMDKNLVRLGSTISPDLQRSLSQIEAQLHVGEGVSLRLQATERMYDQLFPSRITRAITSDDVLRNARTRWDEEYATLKRAANLQGLIGDSIEADRNLLGDAMARSRNAAGMLEATQAGNELQGLSIKQSLALQGLLSAQHRAETLAKARDLATENEARQRFKSFLGEGTAYAGRR